MNYEIKEISLDNYELHYISKNGEKRIRPFKRTIELASKIESGDANARFKLYEELTKMGKTKEDFIIERKEDGKIIRDETNYRELEMNFINQEMALIALEVYKKLFGIELPDLLNDMGILDNEVEVSRFSRELREVLINGKSKTPSIQEIKEQ